MRKVHGWRRVARWMIGIAGGLLGLLTVVLVVVFIVFQTGWGRRVLKNQIQARLDSTFVGGASIGSVEGNPLSELVLNDVVINGADKQPAIVVKRLTVTLPLMPLISRQVRVESILAEELDVRVRRLANGELNLANLTRKGEPSTWSIALPNVEVHRGHLLLDQVIGSEPIDIDHLEIALDAALPFGGPLAANARITGTWRQKQAPISIGAVLRGDSTAFEVRNAGIQIGDVRAIALGVKLPRSAFSKPLAGTIAVHARAQAVRELVPSVRLPADIALSINAHAEGRLTYFRAFAAVGQGELAAYGRADVVAKLASGVVVATDLDLRELTTGTLDGHGGGIAALQFDGSTHDELPTVAGMITAWSKLRDTPPFEAVIAIDSRGDRVRATIGAASETGIRASAGGTIRKHGETIVLERSDLLASTVNIRRAIAGAAPVGGRLTASLRAEGTLAPRTDLSIVGHANGRKLAVQGFRADRLALRVDAAHVPSHPVGRGRVEIDGLAQDDLKLGRLTIAAGSRPDGKLQVSVRSEPKPSLWRVDVDALVTIGETFVVELQRHLVRAGGGSTWSGTTGRLTIGPRRIELRDLRSASETGTIIADAMYVRAGRDRGDLAARVDASVALGSIAKSTKGRVEAHVDLKRANRRFTGTVLAKGRGVAFDRCAPITFDGDVKIEARNEQLTANIELSTAKSGSAKFALDVDAPKDITSVPAWRKLDRSAIRTAQLTLNDVQVADFTKLVGVQSMNGRIDGSVELSPARAGGTLKIRGAAFEPISGLGTIDADLGVAPLGGDAVKATLTARLAPIATSEAAKVATQNGAAHVSAEASFETPERIFDPAAWKQLGPNAFRGATLRAERLAFQPGTLERLGIVSSLRGELGVGVEIEPGMQAVRFSVNVHELRGGVFVQPVAIDVVGAIDDLSTRVKTNVRTQGITLLHLSSEIPITLEQLRANPQSVKNAPLTAHARIEQVPAKTLMNVIGTSQISGGTLDGTVDIAGTVGRPTVDAKFVARGVAVPSEATHQVQHIRELKVAATWDGAAGNVEIDGDQSAGGKLKLRATGSPVDLDRVTASIKATKLDIAPLVAFMPGQIGGIGGRMDANLTLRGANPRTAQLAGSVRVTNGRIPIAAVVGTMFNGDIKIDIKDDALALRATGKLGRGDVSVAANAPLEGMMPKNGKIQIRAHNVRLIGVSEPILTGVIDSNVTQIGFVWHFTVRITKMTVKVPEDRGAGLSPVGVPDDMVFGGERIHHGKGGTDAPSTGKVDEVEAPRVNNGGPALVAHIEMRNVFVESDEVRGIVGGKLAITVDDDLRIGMDGNLSLSRGVLELFSRRYDIDKALVSFDGSTDPLLDIRITHDFPDATTITEVRGRLSNPRLVMTSDPGRYSQAELLGFLLGGEPGGDPQRAPSTSDRVVGAGASLVSNRISGVVRQALPVDIDVLRYEVESATSSAAFTVGTWVTDTLFLAYRRRLEARPDENSGEGEVEWWIRRRLVIEGVLGDRNINGADLLWRRRW